MKKRLYIETTVKGAGLGKLAQGVIMRALQDYNICIYQLVNGHDKTKQIVELGNKRICDVMREIRDFGHNNFIVAYYDINFDNLLDHIERYYGYEPN